MNSKEILETNERQKEFYNKKKKNLATKLWYSLRNGLLQDLRNTIGLEFHIHKLHLSWLGDLSNKKVLDLGCYAGNSLSMYLAKNSKEYIAIDLSEKGISSLRKRLKDLPNASAFTIDFFAEEFTENNFDLIYAYGVLHHFKDVDNLIEKLNEKLNRSGEIISYDPLQTSFPLKFIRNVYRPFQTDRDWEWPFSQETFFKFNKAFRVKERRGMLGKSKYFFFVKLLPLSSSMKLKIGKDWHVDDWEKSSYSDKHLFKCMHLTMWMAKKDAS